MRYAEDEFDSGIERIPLGNPEEGEGIEDIGLPPPGGDVGDDFVPAYDTRTANEFEADQEIIPAAGEVEGGEPGAPPARARVPKLTVIGDKARIERADGTIEEFEPPPTRKEPGEAEVGKHNMRTKFRSHLVEKMFAGEDPEKMSPIQIGEKAKQKYIDETLGGLPFYQRNRISKDTYNAMLKEANSVGKQAMDTAMKIRQERLKTVDAYMKRFDKDITPQKETSTWVEVKDPSGNWKQFYLPPSRIQALQTEGYDIRRPSERTGGGKPTMQWVQTPDGKKKLMTNDEIRQAQARGEDLEKVSTAKPEDIVAKKNKAMAFMKNIFSTVPPGERMKPGSLKELNQVLEEAGMSPLVEKPYQKRNVLTTPFGDWSVPLGFWSDKNKPLYEYDWADGGESLKAAPAEAPIDKTKPQIKNEDGSVSTERTITVEKTRGGEAVNIPTIIQGKQVSNEEAVRLWKEGKNPEVGTYKTRDEAVAAAKKRSSDIGKSISTPTVPKGTKVTVDGKQYDVKHSKSGKPYIIGPDGYPYYLE